MSFADVAKFAVNPLPTISQTEGAARTVGGLIGSGLERITSTDPYEIASRSIRGAGLEFPGIGAPPIPSKSGTGTRQSRVLSGRDGRLTRNLVRWFLPETGIVEMYINPQNITYQEKKHISNVRTKGGYILQYWGEEMGTIALNGTTGSSGVEGINVLYDVYRNEQVNFDAFALTVEAAQEAEQLRNELDGSPLSLLSGAENLLNTAQDRFFDNVNNIIETGSSNVSRPKPTLASLAFSVEMYWSGWVFRGYFTDMRVEEKADRIGLFDYSMNFTVTQRRGFRTNFFAWHRSPTDGPSNSDPRSGVPYSFGSMAEEAAIPNGRGESESTGSRTDAQLRSDQPVLNQDLIPPRSTGPGTGNQFVE
jgi:hypothetical protein